LKAKRLTVSSRLLKDGGCWLRRLQAGTGAAEAVFEQALAPQGSCYICLAARLQSQTTSSLSYYNICLCPNSHFEKRRRLCLHPAISTGLFRVFFLSSPAVGGPSRLLLCNLLCTWPGCNLLTHFLDLKFVVNVWSTLCVLFDFRVQQKECLMYFCGGCSACLVLPKFSGLPQVFQHLQHSKICFDFTLHLPQTRYALLQPEANSRIGCNYFGGGWSILPAASG
jgi:hypothetical protein